MNVSSELPQCTLIFVAYHSDHQQIAALQACLEQLSSRIAYAIVVNDYHRGEAVELLLSAGATLFLTFSENLGYGRAVNAAVRQLIRRGPLPTYLGAMNMDLIWKPGTFEAILDWLDAQEDVVLAVPQLLDDEGHLQLLCKQNPTLLSLLSRRFIPHFLKPRFLCRYDQHYVMESFDYNTVFEVPYLSGCCMIMRSEAFLASGGFDERFFLYLEDADITRSMSQLGKTVHLPIASVTHQWGRGNHRNIKLTIVNLHSAWIYFRKWGFQLW